MIDDLLYSVLLFVIGAIAAFINVNAGGGSSLTLPALIFLGLDAATANGTNRIAVLFQNMSAVHAFKKENYHQFNLSWKFSLLTLPGAILGAVIAIDISDDAFQKILAVIMIGIIISILFPITKKTKPAYTEEKKLTFPVIISLLLIGFYGGFIQVGIGFLLMALLQKLMGFSLIYVNVHKVFIVLILTIPALLIFILSGKVNWYWGISLAIGNSFGGWWAAKISVKKGDSLIKAVLAISIFLMAIKLLSGF